MIKGSELEWRERLESSKELYLESSFSDSSASEVRRRNPRNINKQIHRCLYMMTNPLTSSYTIEQYQM